MDILLTHGYFLSQDPAEQKIMKPYPPLGILYISSYLKSKGFDVGVFDSTFESVNRFKEFISVSRPSIVGIYVTLMTKLPALELIRLCREHGCRVIVGGPDVAHYAEHYIGHGADVAVIGEGEITLEELIPHLLRFGPEGMEAIHGIAYRNGEGEVVRTPPRALIPDLDALPLPDRGAIQLRRYIEVWKDHHGSGAVSLITARGCPFRCTWCSRSVFGETHRRRSPEKVVNEIETIIEEYSPDMLWFADDVFTLHQGWIGEFHAAMRLRNMRIPFECISRADRLNEEILRTMADLGAFRIWYGSESGSQRILDAMQRRVSVEQIRKVTSLAKAFGIQTGLFVMLGYPGEELKDIDATIEHLKATNPDTYLTTVAYPIKGTTFYDEVEDQIIAASPWARVTDRSIQFRGRHTNRFYWFATRHLVNEIRAHRRRMTAGPANKDFLTSYAKSKVARAGMFLTSFTRT